MAVSAYAEPMSETYRRPRFGEPREPKNLINPGSRLMRVVDFVTEASENLAPQIHLEKEDEERFEALVAHVHARQNA